MSTEVIIKSCYISSVMLVWPGIFRLFYAYVLINKFKFNDYGLVGYPGEISYKIELYNMNKNIKPN